MYPYKLIEFPDGSGLSLYEIFILLGVIAAIVMFRVLADHNAMPAKLQNLILIGAVVSFIVGYFSAVLFQAIYNIASIGAFILDSQTGSTFYGGFIGGVCCMLLIYFVGGHFLFKKEKTHLRWFFAFANIAAVCIPLAHGLGRIGCLTAGCCHGGETDAWFGIRQYIELSSGEYGWRTVVPLQLFEAIFLIALASVLFILVWKAKWHELPIYLSGYGIWRFLIEFLRTDDRGTSFLSFLSPSQITAIFMILIAAVLIAGNFILMKKGKMSYFVTFQKIRNENGNASKSEDSAL